MYHFTFTKIFQKKYKKMIKKNKSLEKIVDSTLEIIRENPHSSSLCSHKVESKNFGKKWSSRVTNDIRIIWDFSEIQVNIIDILDMGGRSGGEKVYR